VPSKDAHAFAAERVPDVARPVVVATEEDAAGDRERDRGDAAQDVVVRENIELAVRANVEEPARRVVRTSREGVAVGEEPAIFSEGGRET
jgi:hypothetical protein